MEGARDIAMGQTGVFSIILSGEAIRDYIESGSLDRAWKRVFLRFADGAPYGARVARRVVVLGPDLWGASKVCLEAGFEVIPALNEDYRAAVEILHGAHQRQFDEILFALSGDPIPLLQRIPAEVRKTWVTGPGSERIDEVRPWCDAVLELPRFAEQETAPQPEEPVQTIPGQPDEAVRRHLETILAAEGYKVALDRLRQSLPEADSSPAVDEDEFRRQILRILPEHIRYVKGDNGGTLIHQKHPSFTPIPVSEALGRLTLGDSQPEKKAESDEEPGVSRRTALEEIPAQAELLAAQFRSLKQRLSSAASPGMEEGPLAEQDEEFKRRGKEIGVFLWPLWHDLPGESLDRFAQCYTALAASFSLLSEIDREEKPTVRDGFFDQAAQLAATVLCALKTLLLDHDLTTTTCRVQKEAFGLVREIASKRHVWLEFMRAGDRVEEEQFLTTEEDLGRLRQAFRAAKTRTRTKQELFRKCRYHLGKLPDVPDPRHDWDVIVASVTELVVLHRVPESSIEFRELLEPHFDAMDAIPDEVETSPEFGRVIQHIELYLDQRAAETAPEEKEEEAPPDAIAPEIRAVRERFRDSRVVFVGGTPVPHVQHRIQEAFQIELAWPEARHGDSLDQHFKAYLDDERTRLFLIYIPWCSHAHSRELGQWVKQAGKDFVRLTRGTNPASIALAICDQLGIDPAEPPPRAGNASSDG